MINECAELKESDDEATETQYYWGKYKTKKDAMDRYKVVRTLFHRRERHVKWYRTQRAVVQRRSDTLKWEDGGKKEVLAYLDYGTIYDSDGKHVDIWSSTLVWRPNGTKQTHSFNIFYEKKDWPNGTKNKNSSTGRMGLRELVDPACNVEGDYKKSALEDLCAGVTHLILSGDTGNGFRGVPMSYYHTMLWHLHRLVVEQIPLPPRHAWNLTDAQFARLNTFFRKLMRVGFLRGPKQFAEMLRRATDQRCTDARRLIKNCTSRFRIFRPEHNIEVPAHLIPSIKIKVNNVIIISL
jgi:hypothetical protein